MTLNEIQAIANLTAKFLGLPIKPRAKIKDSKRGYAHTTKGWFSIPKWAFDHGEKFVIYYVVHEVCHFYKGTLYHGKKFCQIEDKALRFWGLYIQRKKVYPEPYAIYKL
jgi:predicted metal-dependent hydrolase